MASPPPRPRHRKVSLRLRPTSPTSAPTIPTPETSPFVVPVPTGEGPSRPPLARTDSGHPRERPETPLDFLLNLSRPKRATSPRSESMHRRMRSSIDADRPLKGVPQSFPHLADDMLALPSAAHVTPSRRLGSFRESTRAKLASFSGFHKDKDRPGQPSALSSGETNGAGNTRSNVHISRTGLPTRSSSLAIQSVLMDAEPNSTSGTRDDGREGTELVDAAHLMVPELESATDKDIDRAYAESTESGTTTGEFSNLLFTPGSEVPGVSLYEHSIASTQSSASNRERVLGLRNDGDGKLPGPRVFIPQKLSDVLPYGTDPFSAWDIHNSEGETGKLAGRRPSVRTAQRPRSLAAPSFDSAQVEEEDGWKDLPKPRGAVGAKRIWVDSENEATGVYRVGYERDVLDLEGRLHEAMWDVAGESHTFATFPDDQQPKAVLDVGTGTGLWPISQALEWKESTFIGLDLVPSQTDLDALVKAETIARSTSSGRAEGVGLWADLQTRIKWDRADFLRRLPYDTGVFDMVHLRFVGLGIPESKWGDLLEECTRVLKIGGTLEIVEMGYTLPAAAPSSLRNSFASLLLSDLVQPDPSLSLRFNLPCTPGLRAPGSLKPAFEKTWRAPPPALGEAAMIWVKSALQYKGTGLVRGGSRNERGERVLQELCDMDEDAWINWIAPSEEVAEGSAGRDKIKVWAWVITKG